MKSFSFYRLWIIAKKEWLHIVHDPRSLTIVFLMPLLQLIIFGYAMNMEIKNVRLAVYDTDNSGISQDLVKLFTGSPFFNVTKLQGSPTNLHQDFQEGKFQAALIVKPQFANNLNKHLPAAVELVTDAADPNAATLIGNYARQIIARFNSMRGLQPLLQTRSTILFNPGLSSSYFFVPGLVALILVMICALLTSITITREKETGTLEQLGVTPARPLEIITGKLLPYIGLGFAVGLMILLAGIWLFDVAFIGSVALLAGLSFLYILAALGLGVMISTIAPNQQVAMMLAVLLTMLPTIMLSGFIFPVGSMPTPLQVVSHLVPARYYLKIIRGIMLRGNHFSELVKPIQALIIFTVLTLGVAIKRYSRGQK